MWVMLNCVLLDGARSLCGCGFSLVLGLLHTKLLVFLDQNLGEADVLRLKLTHFTGKVHLVDII
jgi:hypothetical protein